MTLPHAGSNVIERMNADCLCLSLDAGALSAAFASELGDAAFAARLLADAPGLISRQPVFLSAGHAARMAAVIRAIEDVATLPAYRAHVLAHAPPIARFDPGPIGVFMGYDFHLGPDGPRLIEINTNAGGALINAYLASAQTACCRDVAHLLPGPAGLKDVTDGFAAAFGKEWSRQGRAGSPSSIAIVDDEPAKQFLHPEFQLFQKLFERHGMTAVIADPRELAHQDGAMLHAGRKIDLVYNRLTDFALGGAGREALRAAYLAGDAVVTPNPRAHALLADKRNLIALTDAELLRGWGAPAETISVLQSGIAMTQAVSREKAGALWAAREKLFFKPGAGFGSRAAYRGGKLTRKVWEAILEAGGYVAQELVQPSRRGVKVDGQRRDMKVDLRNYTYDGAVQLMAARVYEGQTTNMRTAGGGFAPVLAGDVDMQVDCGCA